MCGKEQKFVGDQVVFLDGMPLNRPRIYVRSYGGDCRGVPERIRREADLQTACSTVWDPPCFHGVATCPRRRIRTVPAGGDMPSCFLHKI